MSKAMKNKIKVNFENMEKIDKKYDELITNMVIYIRVALNEKDAEEAINDILEILLGAQHRGEDLGNIIGEDYKNFCDEVISSYKGENKLYFLSSFKEILLMVLAMLPFFIALNCVVEIGKVKNFSMEGLWNAKYNLGIIPILGNFIAIPVIYFLLAYIAKNPGKDNRKDFLVFFIIQIVYIGFLVFVGYLLRNIVLLSIPNYFICLIVSIILLIGYFYYLRKLSK